MSDNSNANGDADPRHLETLDRDLSRYSRLEAATQYVARPIVGPGIAVGVAVVRHDWSPVCAQSV
ncbi:MAG: hypothetical protein AAGL89_14680, partial [Pseudomonadota bacterium]